MTKQKRVTLAAVRAVAKKKGLRVEDVEPHYVGLSYQNWHMGSFEYSSHPRSGFYGESLITRAQALTAMMAALRTLKDKPKEKR